MQDTRKKSGGKVPAAPRARKLRKLKAPQTATAFRRQARYFLNRAGIRTTDPVVRAVFLELLEILCDAFKLGGMPEVRRVWAEAKRVVFKRA